MDVYNIGNPPKSAAHSSFPGNSCRKRRTLLTCTLESSSKGALLGCCSYNSPIKIAFPTHPPGPVSHEVSLLKGFFIVAIMLGTWGNLEGYALEVALTAANSAGQVSILTVSVIGHPLLTSSSGMVWIRSGYHQWYFDQPGLSQSFP
jgi:hypothetical protein